LSLKHEQKDIVEPIYKRQSSKTLEVLSSMAIGQGRFCPSFDPSISFKGSDIKDWKQRFDHGMNVIIPAFEHWEKTMEQYQDFKQNHPYMSVFMRMDEPVRPEFKGITNFTKQML